MICILDYQAGNLTSVKKALDHLGVESKITTHPDAVAKADKIILPGVGHFSATEQLTRSGLRQAVSEAIQRGTPFLGICVGMQWMFESSTEAPEVPGLGLFAGRIEHFPPGVKSPHVGWNGLETVPESRLLRGVGPEPFVYFTHSYRAPLVRETVARTEYGGAFSAAVERDNIFGVQFHPEKSGAAGLKMLENFCRGL
jgi:glutamine amidotransferase